jgi:pilus assembly protein CpaF
VTPVKPELVELVRARLVASGAPPTVHAIGRVVRDSGLVLDRPALAALTTALADELVGLGPLDALVRDPSVSDVLVNSPDEVWADRGAGLVRAPQLFRDEAAVRQLAVRLAARAGRRLDDAQPFVDARLPDGVRLHAVLPPLAVRGTTISLRIPSRRQFGLADLVASGTVDEQGGELLAAIVRSRVAFLVTGGTGSGKTSVLGAMLGRVGGDERMVIVEDTTELRPEHPHVVSLEARPANVEGSGEVSLRTLVRQALRMRPDRLVVGEVRGAEVVDMLAGFNTGHEGGCGTLHANCASAVPDRMAALALAAGMSLNGVVAQMRAGLDLVVHLARRPDGRRVLSEVGTVTGRGEHVEVVSAVSRQEGRLRPSASHAVLRDRVGWSP